MQRLILGVLIAITLGADASVAGTWNVAMQGSDHVIPIGMELKQDGTAVTGKILMPTGRIGERYEVGLTGEFAEGALKLSGVAEEKSNAADLRLVATMQDDGTLAGTIYPFYTPDQGRATLKWTADRLKKR